MTTDQLSCSIWMTYIWMTANQLVRFHRANSKSLIRFATWQTGVHWVSAFVQKIPNTASLSEKFYCQSIHPAKKKPFSAQGGGSRYCSSALRSLGIRGSGLLGPDSPRMQANLQRQPATPKTHLQHPNLTLFHLQLEITCPLCMDIDTFP